MTTVTDTIRNYLNLQIEGVNTAIGTDLEGTVDGAAHNLLAELSVEEKRGVAHRLRHLASLCEDEARRTERNIGRVTVPDYFGGCPHCGKITGRFNNHMDHWAVCDVHRVQWWCASNTFEWQSENQVIWAANRGRYGHYQRVEPLPTGNWSTDPEVRALELAEDEREATGLR